MRVQDDGVGFDPHLPGIDKHYGVVLMKERAGMAGGELFIESEAGVGTVVVGKFPMRPPAQPE